METEKQRKYNKLWAVTIGAGLALLPIHNTTLTGLVTLNGEVGFFIPAFGYAVMIIGTGAFAVYNWEKLEWGDKRVYIPLLMIVAAIGLSGITADSWQDKVSPLFMGLSFFALYLVARKLGKDIFLPLAIGAGIASFGVIVSSLINPGVVTGGLLFEGNYDIVVGYVLIGVAMFVRRYQWLIAGLALVAMIMTGSPEALFVIVVVSIAVLIRGDWGVKLVVITAPIIILGMLYIGMGHYSYLQKVLANQPTVGKVSALEYRLKIAEGAISDIKPLGAGFNLTGYTPETVHNVPLIIVQQLGIPGIIAAVMWAWVSLWCIIKTKWKYVWVLVLSLSVFDHFIWTQLAPYWWAIVGVTTASNIESDLIFREVK